LDLPSVKSSVRKIIFSNDDSLSPKIIILCQEYVLVKHFLVGNAWKLILSIHQVGTKVFSENNFPIIDIVVLR
jgi:hypothetical protein